MLLCFQMNHIADELRETTESNPDLQEKVGKHGHIITVKHGSHKKNILSYLGYPNPRRNRSFI